MLHETRNAHSLFVFRKTPFLCSPLIIFNQHDNLKHIFSKVDLAREELLLELLRVLLLKQVSRYSE